MALFRSIASPGRYGLDIGCGRGRLAFKIAPRLAHVIGIDLAVESIDLAQAEAVRSGIDNVTFFVADAEHVDYSEFLSYEPYDLVTAHLCFSETIAHRAYAALRRGGRILAVSCHTSQWQETGHASRFALDGNALQSILSRSGFELEYLGLESEILEYESPDQLAAAWLGKEGRPKWLTPERAEGIAAHARHGGITFTIRSHLIARAQKRYSC
jgi:SAM-dependent methyltransferase